MMDPICESMFIDLSRIFVCLANVLSRIRIDIEGAAGTLYAGEKFQLLFKFTDQYPFDSPQVIHQSHSPHSHLTFILGDFYRFTYSSPSSYLFQWSYLSFDTNG